MKAIEISEVEAAAQTMLPVIEQMPEPNLHQAFIMGASWALNEVDRRKVMRMHESEAAYVGIDHGQGD